MLTVGNQITNEMGRACGTYEFQWGNLKEILFENIRANARMILKSVFKTIGMGSFFL
jgi:hypothetical protein